MGTDITGITEVRASAGWELLPGEFPFGDPRSYSLFAVLADVRNIQPPIRPIAAPRGIPGDISPGGQMFLRAKARQFGVTFEEFCQGDIGFGGHSWVLLSELADYPWDAHPATARLGPSVLADLHRLGQLAPLDQLRFVFWFDS